MICPSGGRWWRRPPRSRRRLESVHEGWRPSCGKANRPQRSWWKSCLWWRPMMTSWTTTKGRPATKTTSYCWTSIRFRPCLRHCCYCCCCRCWNTDCSGRCRTDGNRCWASDCYYPSGDDVGSGDDATSTFFHERYTVSSSPRPCSRCSTWFSSSVN